jgi:hypothetical protein
VNNDQFSKIVEDQVNKCLDMLIRKGKEYVTGEDRLSAFKTAAVLQHCTPPQALQGMNAKHTVSVYDMVATGQEYPMALWEEKITDTLIT